MRKRLESLLVDVTPRVVRERIPIFAALQRVRAKGYTRADFRADLLAGIVVGIVALPLSMALSIAVGVAPQHGLYTAVVAGIVVGITGGSKFQVTGPTAAFVVILAPIVTKYGLPGLLTAGFMAGIILIIMGIARFGRFIQFIPHPVTTGFTAGIAVVIATLQIKDVCGIKLAAMPDGYTDKIRALWNARHTAGRHHARGHDRGPRAPFRAGLRGGHHWYALPLGRRRPRDRGHPAAPAAPDDTLG